MNATDKPESTEQLLPNILASWMAFCATAVIGFVMPRLILDQIGHQMLGVWDLSWSFLVFVSFNSIGSGSAVSHFIARIIGRIHEPNMLFRARSTFATGFYLQLLFALMFATVFNFALSTLPTFLTATFDADQLVEIQQISFFISAAVVVAMLGEIAHCAFIGIHQSRRSEYINVCHDVTLAITMMSVLAVGFGIVGLAAATFVVRLLFELVRFVAAVMTIEGYNIYPTNVSFPQARHLLRYGIKSSFYGFQELIVYQTLRFMLFVLAGPMVFAAFSRYSTLARQINRLVDRLVTSVPALASDISGREDNSDIRNIYKYGAQTNLMLTLPVLSIFAVFGDNIVRLWMGNAFVIPQLAWYFCAACILHSQYAISEKILRGANSHGKISLFCIISSSLALAGIYFADHTFNAYSAALTIALLMLCCVHLPVIFFTWYRLEIKPSAQVIDIYIKPLAANLVYLALLVQVSAWINNQAYTIAAVSWLVGTLTLSFYYWFWICDQRLRTRIKTALPNFVTSS